MELLKETEDNKYKETEDNKYKDPMFFANVH
jgi:hypothetical protein